jgi:hypothetical protein
VYQKSISELLNKFLNITEESARISEETGGSLTTEIKAK